MKVTVKHYLTRTQFTPGMAPEYALWPVKLDGEYYAIVGEQDIELDIPDDFDPRPQQIAALEEQRLKAMADYSALMNVIDGKIQSLRCIEHKPEVSHEQ